MLLLLALFYLLFLPHYALAIRIILRPVVHNVFNISLAIYFVINATGGPFLMFFYYKAIHNFLWEKPDEIDKSDCSRLIELRHMEGEGFKIISSNIMFRSETKYPKVKEISTPLQRFFYIVYADRGFVRRGGRVDTRFFNVCFVLITLALALRHLLLFQMLNFGMFFSSGFLGFRLAAPLMSPEYPANTVLGRSGQF